MHVLTVPQADGEPVPGGQVEVVRIRDVKDLHHIRQRHHLNLQHGIPVGIHLFLVVQFQHPAFPVIADGEALHPHQALQRVRFPVLQVGNLHVLLQHHAVVVQNADDAVAGDVGRPMPFPYRQHQGAGVIPFHADQPQQTAVGGEVLLHLLPVHRQHVHAHGDAGRRDHFLVGALAVALHADLADRVPQVHKDHGAHDHQHQGCADAQQGLQGGGVSSSGLVPRLPLNHRVLRRLSRADPEGGIMRLHAPGALLAQILVHRAVIKGVPAVPAVRGDRQIAGVVLFVDGNGMLARAVLHVVAALLPRQVRSAAPRLFLTPGHIAPQSSRAATRSLKTRPRSS